MELENADLRRRESSRRTMKPDGSVLELELIPPGSPISSFVASKAPAAGVLCAEEVEGSSSWIIGTAHLVTVIIGAGVLSLPSACALLGWVLGPTFLVLFGCVSLWTSFMLTDIYEVEGKKYRTYKEAVLAFLGPQHRSAVSVILYLQLWMVTVAYTIAGATSMQFIAETACEWQGITSGCLQSQLIMTVIFSSVQLLLNMMPSLESIWWISAMGAICSYTYSGIALCLSCYQLSTGGISPDTTLFGMEAETPMKRAFGMFQALGNVAFAWSCAVLIISIQVTLKEPPKAAVSMKKTIVAAFLSTASFYISVAVTGYAALGSAAPGDVLTGFTVSNEVELVANVAVLLHMVAAVQVFQQPLYEAFEEGLGHFYPHLIRKDQASLLIFRMGYRAANTAVVTIVASAVPHFSLFAGLIGALTFWPLSVFYPMALFETAHNPPRTTRLLMYATSGFMLAVCILATIGSIYSFSQV